MADKAHVLTLRLLTPTGTSAEILCDSVQLTLRDDADGKGGGLVGILPGHAPAVMALGPGAIRASLKRSAVFRARAKDGFASVRDNVITVITDSAEIIENKQAPKEGESL